MMDTDIPAMHRLAAPWRRLLALIVDVVLLSLICWGIGSLAADLLIPLGDWARLTGLGVMVAYFTWLDSHLGSGASPGKRLFGIHVLDTNGNELSPARAAIRAGIIAPAFLVPDLHHGAETLLEMTVGWALWGLAAYGLFFAGLYLIVCDRRNRQGLHDWVTNTLVARFDAPYPEPQPIWRPHLVIAGGILVVAACLPLLSYTLMSPDGEDLTPFERIATLSDRLHLYPAILAVDVNLLWYHDGQRAVTVNVLLDEQPLSHLGVAPRVGRQLRAAMPEFRDTPVVVIMRHGWTLGLAESYANERYVLK